MALQAAHGAWSASYCLGQRAKLLCSQAQPHNPLFCTIILSSVPRLTSEPPLKDFKEPKYLICPPLTFSAAVQSKEGRDINPQNVNTFHQYNLSGNLSAHQLIVHLASIIFGDRDLRFVHTDTF